MLLTLRHEVYLIKYLNNRQCTVT